LRGEDVRQLGRHLDFADAGLRLRVGNAEPRPIGIVQPDLAQLDVAQLADADAGARECLDDRPAAGVWAGVDGAEVPQVVHHGRLRK
jgi:hypothetical protein